MRLDPEILDGPPDAGARVVALAHLADAEDAVRSFADPARGPAALEALAGALRRLHGTLRALAPVLEGTIRERDLDAVSAAWRRAQASRDARCLAGFLTAVRGQLPGAYRGALDWLADRIEARRAQAEEAVAAEVVPRMRAVVPELEARLAARGGPPGAGEAEPFGSVLASVVRAQTRALRDALSTAAGGGDAPGLERALADAERLHDLLEPLRGSGLGADEAIGTVDALRRVLSELRDAQRAEAALDGALLLARVEEVRRGAAAIGGLRPGLLALVQLASGRVAELRARIARDHLASKGVATTDASYAVVAALEERDGRAPAGGEGEGEASAPERRFLLTAIPPEGRGGDVEELEQGWLPGDGRESVGVTRSALGEQWFRARAPGRGRPGHVESVSRTEFETYWPLTEGRRIAKRRHLVPAWPGWHLDEYQDRSLVLAVAEEGNADAPPPWMEPALVREVSLERGYLDEALARRPARRAG